MEETKRQTYYIPYGEIPSWSPDGRNIVLNHYGEEGQLVMCKCKRSFKKKVH
jgi:Tol biopolymer transport system component